MTVAIWVKVFDGIVLATDSATTLTAVDTNGQRHHQVYNNADKIFHLHRQLPIGAMTWGQGTVGPASISTLSKSFRLRLMGRDSHFADWELDVDNFTVREVAERASKMFALAASDAGATEFPGELGYLVAGISSNCDQAEVWLLQFSGNNLEPEPVQILTDAQYGFRAYAQPGAVNRLFNGYDERIEAMLRTSIPESEHDSLDEFLRSMHLDPVQPGMPLPDAISLAKFMVETTEGYTRFRIGADTVGGPVEVASINPHEGFTWISRKHYFSPDLNAGERL